MVVTSPPEQFIGFIEVEILVLVVCYVKSYISMFALYPGLFIKWKKKSLTYVVGRSIYAVDKI